MPADCTYLRRSSELGGGYTRNRVEKIEEIYRSGSSELIGGLCQLRQGRSLHLHVVGCCHSEIGGE